MQRRTSDAPGHAELLDIIKQVRQRWRLKLALRGLAVIAAFSLLTFLISVFLLDRTEFSPGLVLGLRIATVAIFLGLTVWFLVMPQWKRISDERVALYLEEREPSLHASLLSALAVGNAVGEDSAISSGLARKTIETAVERCRAVDNGRRIEKQSLQRSSGVLAGVVIAGLLLFFGGPSFVRNGAETMLLPLSRAEA
ncbi:MAG: hypothetical protein KY464_15060, partial [Gemmatimonadetes bacterium]|nr:hypothetical protein [Gemmatimonadota bacterium]